MSGGIEISIGGLEENSKINKRRGRFYLAYKINFRIIKGREAPAL